MFLLVFTKGVTYCGLINRTSMPTMKAPRRVVGRVACLHRDHPRPQFLYGLQ